MAIKEQLIQSANIVKDEFRPGANTATRIGNLFLQIIDALVDIEQVDSSYLSKTKEDIAQELITFLSGISVGENNDASITSDGNGYFKNLKVAGALDVFELNYNQQQAVRGDLFFTDSATIKSVESTGDNSYYITLEASDFDLLAFQEHDVLRGSIRTNSGGVLQSWMRVTRTDATNNAISVIAYPSAEVDGGVNNSPTELMVLAHWGNAINKERQRTWYLSNAEGRFVLLDGVTKPILEDYNVASFIGLPMDLAQFKNLPINYKEPYIYARGLITQDHLKVDYNGMPVVEVIDRGFWFKDVTYSNGSIEPFQQDDVWHNGCKWRCIVDGTTQEPRWNATDWVLISGDSRLSLELTATNGNQFRFGTVDTTFIAVVYHGNTDITSDIKDYDWEWLRESGNVNDDKDWAERHKNTTSSIHIGNEDVGMIFTSTSV